MKRKACQIVGFFSAAALLLAGCEKVEERLLQEDLDVSDKGYVAVYNGSLNSVRNNLFVDGTATTGLAGTFGYGSLFPGTVFGVAVDPGQRTFIVRDTLASTTQTPITVSANVAAGSKYTIFTYDTLTRTKARIVETSIVITDSSRVRLVNLIFSTTPVPNIDVFSVRRNANIFTNVAPEQITGYIPYSSFRTDTLYVRATGTTVNLTPILTFSATPRRSYTLVFRGRYQTTGTTGVARLLSVFADY